MSFLTNMIPAEPEIDFTISDPNLSLEDAVATMAATEAGYNHSVESLSGALDVCDSLEVLYEVATASMSSEGLDEITHTLLKSTVDGALTPLGLTDSIVPSTESYNQDKLLATTITQEKLAVTLKTLYANIRSNSKVVWDSLRKFMQKVFLVGPKLQAQAEALLDRLDTKSGMITPKVELGSTATRLHINGKVDALKDMHDTAKLLDVLCGKKATYMGDMVKGTLFELKRIQVAETMEEVVDAVYAGFENFKGPLDTTNYLPVAPVDGLTYYQSQEFMGGFKLQYASVTSEDIFRRQYLARIRTLAPTYKCITPKKSKAPKSFLPTLKLDEIKSVCKLVVSMAKTLEDYEGHFLKDEKVQSKSIKDLEGIAKSNGSLTAAESKEVSKIAASAAFTLTTSLGLGVRVASSTAVTAKALLTYCSKSLDNYK